jgi:hypothetical protein
VITDAILRTMAVLSGTGGYVVDDLRDAVPPCIVVGMPTMS